MKKKINDERNQLKSYFVLEGEKYFGKIKSEAEEWNWRMRDGAEVYSY